MIKHTKKNLFCKFGNFHKDFIFVNICGLKNSLLWHDLPISVNDSDFGIS